MRALGDGFELDGDPGRLDRAAIHAYLGMHRLYAKLGFGASERLLERPVSRR